MHAAWVLTDVDAVHAADVNAVVMDTSQTAEVKPVVVDNVAPPVVVDNVPPTLDTKPVAVTTVDAKPVVAPTVDSKPVAVDKKKVSKEASESHIANSDCRIFSESM